MFSRPIYISVLALSVCGVVFAAETFEEYQTAMRAGAGANAEMRKLIESDLSGAAAAAGKVKTAFGELEAYWKMKGVADAETFAHNVVMDAEKVRAAAAAGNKDGALAAADSLRTNCGSCHEAHRVKAADGSWQIK
jgi:cytochrome c556